MKSVWLTLFSLITVTLWGGSTAHAVIRIVSNSSELQSALNAAVAGDEIILKDGIYTGQFTISGNSGTASAPITVRAENRHQAILQGDNTCDFNKIGLNVTKSWWVIKDLVLRQHGGRSIRLSSTATDVVIEDSLLYDFRIRGISAEGSTRITVKRNVFARGDGCNTSKSGIALTFIANADNNKALDNIFIDSSRNNHYYVLNDQGGVRGYSILVQDDADNNLIQGNLTIGGQAAFRILAGANFTANNNTVRDNAFLFANGGVSIDDCNDHQTVFVNNLMYGNYFGSMLTKGNGDGQRGYHTFQHNLVYINELSRSGSNIGTNTDGLCPNLGGYSYKINNTLKDNLFYSSGATTGVHKLLYMSGQNGNPSSIAAASNNFFWAPDATSNWVHNYSYASTDIHSSSQQPIFTDPAKGDFSLASGSSGRGAASDGADIGIQYNASLKKTWIQNLFALEEQTKTNLGTNVSFVVSPDHYYLVWFRIPEPACNLNPETFTLEGGTIKRNIQKLVTGSLYVQPAGPARWQPLGRHKATDGTLNVSWTNSACADQIKIKELPNPEEAYTWITGVVESPSPSPSPTPTPSPSPYVAIPGRVESESFNTGGQDVAYHDTTSANLGGAYRTNEAVDVKVSPDGSGYSIGYINAGEWLKYDVNVAESGNYNITLQAANGSAMNGALRIEVDGVNVTGTISIPPTGSYQTETTVTGPTIFLDQGTHTLRVFMEASNFDLNSIEFTSNSPPQTPPPSPSNLLITAP